FSWFVWALMSTIAFSAQIVSGSGIGALSTGITALAGFSIAVVAIFWGEKHISKIDVISLFGAMIGIVFWGITRDPLLAVVIIIGAYALGFIPTFRKAYVRPCEETEVTYVLSLLKWGFGFIALASFNFTTALYPAAIFVMNLIFISMLSVRRAELPIH
ncbi:MAG TPA: hypothetical protein VMV38_01235, partial [Candidatus Paceibacterota bacterium]|nr:hypothetical protein [Candidatus Paceibacterota bacterium]